MRSQTTKDDALKRLAYIEGHLKAIRKMVEEDRYCVDVLKQTYAVQRALDKFEATLLHGHLSSCVPTGFHEGKDHEMIEELEALFELSRR
ncbi:MAG TPA: metal-sensitive transcriptional regulator [Chloroflexia bacterium]|nr:metal-sensitive transcriptional regulator [Chloroflexia bacterium]